MIHYLMIAVLACVPFVFFGALAVARPARKRHEAVAVVAIPAPEPRAPRDVSRPYPRPKGSRSKLNRVCPVCGTGSETGDLDRRLFGWQAHDSCVEWLGDWHPQRPAPPPFEPDPELIGYIEQGQRGPKQSGGNNTIVFTGKGPIMAAGGGGGSSSTQNGSFPIASAEDLARAQMSLEYGALSINEARQRILSAFSVPDPAIFTPEGSVTWSAAGDRQPLTRRWRCACGAVGYMEGDLAVHRRWCPMEP